MSGGDLAAILPLIVLAVASVLLLLLIAVRRQHRLCATATALSLLIALGAVAPAGSLAPRQVTPLLLVDGYALFYIALITTSALAVTLLAYGYFEARSRELHEEFYVLLLLGTLGAAVVVTSSHFAAFFLGLETLSISLLYLPHDWSLTVNGTAARTTVTIAGTSWAPSGYVRMAFPLRRSLKGNLTYGVGVENFGNADQIGHIAARSLGGGLRYAFRESQDVSLSLTAQDRSQGKSEFSIGASYGFRF